MEYGVCGDVWGMCVYEDVSDVWSVGYVSDIGGWISSQCECVR